MVAMIQDFLDAWRLCDSSRCLLASSNHVLSQSNDQPVGYRSTIDNMSLLYPASRKSLTMRGMLYDCHEMLSARSVFFHSACFMTLGRAQTLLPRLRNVTNLRWDVADGSDSDMYYLLKRSPSRCHNHQDGTYSNL